MIFDMLNELDNAYSESENGVLDAITESCTKALSILDNVRDDCDIGCFNVVQEAVAVKEEKKTAKKPETKTGDGGKKINGGKTSGNKDDKSVVMIHPAVAVAKAKADKTKEMNIALNRQIDNELTKINKLYKTVSNKDFIALCRIADNSGYMYKSIADAFDRFLKTKAQKSKVTQEGFFHAPNEKTFKQQIDVDTIYSGMTPKAAIEDIQKSLDLMSRPQKTNLSSKMMFTVLAESICNKYYRYRSVSYDELSEKPNDWDENKTNYYKKHSDQYIPVDANDEWNSGEYFQAQETIEYDVKGIEELKTRLAVKASEFIQEMEAAKEELKKNIEEAGKNGGIIKIPDNFENITGRGTVGADKINELAKNFQSIESDLKTLDDPNSGFIGKKLAKARRTSFEIDLDNYNKHWLSTQVKAQRGSIPDKLADTIGGTIEWFAEFIKNVCEGFIDICHSIKDSDDTIIKKYTLTATKVFIKLIWKGIKTLVKMAGVNPIGHIVVPLVSGNLASGLGQGSAIIISLVATVVASIPIKVISGMVLNSIRRWMSTHKLIIDEELFNKIKAMGTAEWKEGQ